MHRKETEMRGVNVIVGAPMVSCGGNVTLIFARLAQVRKPGPRDFVSHLGMLGIDLVAPDETNAQEPADLSTWLSS